MVTEVRPPLYSDSSHSTGLIVLNNITFKSCASSTWKYEYLTITATAVKETTILRLTVCVGANRSGCVKGSVVSRGVWRAETGRGLASWSIQSAAPQQGTHALRAWYGRCH